jgi:putative surface-exposed virulence protein
MGGIGNNQLSTGASINFADGNDTFTLARLFAGAGSIDFGAGADVLTASSLFATEGTTLDFGAGADTFNLSGLLSADNLTIDGLETFNHSGLVVMGLGIVTASTGGGKVWTQTDGASNDVLRLNGVAWTGSGSARVFADALLGETTQLGCATLTGAADCLDLRGGTTAGSTAIRINYSGDDATLGAYNPVGATVVDVNGGASAAGHFVLDPASSAYVADPVLGGSLERPGLFRYILEYDPDTQRHLLVGLPKSEVMEYAILSGAAHSIWHMTANTVTGRQTDLREGAAGGAVWLRTAGEYTRRDVVTTFRGLSQDYAVDNGYKLYAGTILGGLDLLTGSSGEFDYVAGAQIGYVGSSFDLNESDSSGRFSGATGGAYASLWSDWFFLDGALNLNGLTLDYESLALNGVKTTTFLNSIGASAQAGARTMLTENTFAEPLAAVSWVRTSFEEISLNGGEVEPGDAESLRGGLGMRLGATLPGESVSASYFVKGMAWNEFEGESSGVVHNPGVDLPFADEFTGAFGEAELGINVYSADNTLSGFLTSGVKWKDGYSAVNLSLGVRMAW